MTENAFTKKFKTKSEIIEKAMPKILGNNQYKGKTIISLDGGYSSVKGASPNRVFMFPSYAKKVPSELEAIGRVSKNDIQFRNNKTGEIWLVGQVAENMITQRDLDSTTDESMYARYRYNSPAYRVLMATGMAIGLWGTGANQEIFLQTGLPAEYKERDSAALTKALVGEYDVSIKIGMNNWATFQFELDEQHISVMEQPHGTLCATAYDSNGDLTTTGREILSSNCVVLDDGFGTEDVIEMRVGYKSMPHTESDTSMKSVFEEVITRIEKANIGADFKIFQFNKFLEDGVARYFDYENYEEKEVDFTDLLKQVNEELCDKSIKRLMQRCDNLLEYKYLIVTGGTGESRIEQIQKKLSGLKHLTVIPGNVTCNDLSMTYCNVIGYYMYRYVKFKAAAKKAALEAEKKN